MRPPPRAKYAAARCPLAVSGHSLWHCRFLLRRHSRHANEVHVAIDAAGHQILSSAPDHRHT
jgi:hypothetical protein